MSNETQVVTPVVHLNGSGREDLMRQHHEAYMALHAAVVALRSSLPHGRDYYPLGEGAVTLALDQALGRVERVEAVMAEVETIYKAVSP